MKNFFSCDKKKVIKKKKKFFFQQLKTVFCSVFIFVRWSVNFSNFALASVISLSKIVYSIDLKKIFLIKKTQKNLFILSHFWYSFKSSFSSSNFLRRSFIYPNRVTLFSILPCVSVKIFVLSSFFSSKTRVPAT